MACTVFKKKTKTNSEVGAHVPQGITELFSDVNKAFAASL